MARILANSAILSSYKLFISNDLDYLAVGVVWGKPVSRG